MSFLSKLKSFDVYRDIPKDLTEQTLTGATVSVICSIAIAWLFLSEFLSYLAVQRTSEMFVDVTKDSGHAMIQINMNISVPKLPCAVVSVDAQDVMGSHVVDVGGELHKTRLTPDGAEKRDPNGKLVPPDTADYKEQIGEGCRIHGDMIVKKVPGNFHLSAHAHSNLLSVFFGDKSMNVTHIVHDLSFGDQTHHLAEVEEANTNPLKNSLKIAGADPSDPNAGVSYEYYIKIVPTIFQRLSGEQYESYQFVANSNEVGGRYRLPAIYFRYDLSPITVKFVETRKAFSHFLVQICAIVGGVFTVLGLVNSILHTTLRKVLKANMNKLG